MCYVDIEWLIIVRMFCMFVFVCDVCFEDVVVCIDLCGCICENVFSVVQFVEWGIMVDSWVVGIVQGDLIGCVVWDGECMVGYCFVDCDSGEVLVLVLLLDYEGRGIGCQLLQDVVSLICDVGYQWLFLVCLVDLCLCLYGFYCCLGWCLIGGVDEVGDEIFELV